jgi:AcrR family transcriptional regulator
MEALIDETRTFAVATVKKQLEGHATGLDALRNFADGFAERFKSDSIRLRGFAVLLFGAADPSNSALHEQIVATQRLTRAAFREIIVQHNNEHPDRPPSDADTMAALIYAIFRGFTYQWLIDPESISVDAMFREFKRLCPHLLGEAD